MTLLNLCGPARTRPQFSCFSGPTLNTVRKAGKKKAHSTQATLLPGNYVQGSKAIGPTRRRYTHAAVLLACCCRPAATTANNCQAIMITKSSTTQASCIKLASNNAIEVGPLFLYSHIYVKIPLCSSSIDLFLAVAGCWQVRAEEDAVRQ